MRRLKHLLTALTLGASLMASACWFGGNYTGHLEDNYIAYLSGDVVHYRPLGENQFEIRNGQTVAMPFTVFIKVSNHKTKDESGSGDGRITRAVLQYKLIRNGEEKTAGDGKAAGWVTVKEIDSPDWDMNFDEPVALFGRNTINIPGVTEDSVVLIRLYLTDGVYATGDLEEEIDEKLIPDSSVGHGASDEYGPITGWTVGTKESGAAGDGKIKSSTWSAPFVMKVKVKANSGAGRTVRPHR